MLLLCVVWLSPHVCFVSLPTIRCSRAALVSCVPAAASVLLLLLCFLTERIIQQFRAVPHHTTAPTREIKNAPPVPVLRQVAVYRMVDWKGWLCAVCRMVELQGTGELQL